MIFDARFGRMKPMRPPEVTPAVRGVLLTTVGAFVLQMLFDRVGALTHGFGLSLGGLLQLRLWQVITYAFLHDGVMHILVNMLLVYGFGRELEQVCGTRRFVAFYLACAVLAGLGWLGWILMTGDWRATCIGASGAAFAIAGAYAALFPRRELMFLLFFVLPMRMTARNLALLLAAISVGGMLLGLASGHGTIAHAAHLAGGVAGYLYGCWIGRRVSGVDPYEVRVRMRPPHVVDGPPVWFDREANIIDVTPDEPVDPEATDRILEKIRAEGVQSLTRDERRALEEASRRL